MASWYCYFIVIYIYQIYWSHSWILTSFFILIIMCWLYIWSISAPRKLLRRGVMSLGTNFTLTGFLYHNTQGFLHTTISSPEFPSYNYIITRVSFIQLSSPGFPSYNYIITRLSFIQLSSPRFPSDNYHHQGFFHSTIS